MTLVNKQIVLVFCFSFSKKKKRERKTKQDHKSVDLLFKYFHVYFFWQRLNKQLLIQLGRDLANVRLMNGG